MSNGTSTDIARNIKAYQGARELLETLERDFSEAASGSLEQRRAVNRLNGLMGKMDEVEKSLFGIDPSSTEELKTELEKLTAKVEALDSKLVAATEGSQTTAREGNDPSSTQEPKKPTAKV